MEWYLFALIAAVLFGIGEVVRKRALVKEHSHQFLTVFYLTYVLLLFVFLPRVNFQLEAWQFGMMYLKSVFLTSAVIALMHLLKHYDISEVIPLKNTSPIIMLLLGIAFLGEQPSIINIGGILFLLVGTYLLEADHTSASLFRPLRLFHSKKAGYVLLYAFMISLSALTDKFMADSVDIYTYLFTTTFFVGINFLIIQFVKYDGLKDITQTFRRNGLIIALAAAIFFIADMFYLSSLHVQGSLIVLIIPMVRVSTVISTFVGGELFHEKHLKLRVIACAVMILGIFLVVQ